VRLRLPPPLFEKRGIKNVKKKNNGIKRKKEDVLISDLKAVIPLFQKGNHGRCDCGILS
jgi:hypothetical protein